jgi:hypothetical protein
LDMEDSRLQKRRPSSLDLLLQSKGRFYEIERKVVAEIQSLVDIWRSIRRHLPAFGFNLQ